MEKRITGTKHFVAISWLTGALLIILLLTSCVPYTPKPEFESIRYDGKVYTTFDTPIVVVRSKPIIVNMKTTGDYKYTFNLDGITLVSGTQNTITLKDYNSKLNLEKGFFDGIHTLRIIVDAPGRSEKLDVPIKILNQAPEITITQSDTDLTILTKDPDDDEIIEKNITLYKDGSEVEDIKISEGSNDIRSYSPGKYKIVVKAKDKFEADTTKDYEFQIRSFINNVSYDGNTYTSFTEPITVVRSKAISVNVRDTSRKYYYSYKLDDVVLEASTTDNSITLKNYNSKLRLSEDFFNTQHTLEIIITSGSRAEGLKVPLKINNQNPVISVYTLKKTNSTELILNITDPDGDDFREKTIKLFRDGKEITPVTEGVNDITNYPAGNYSLTVTAIDMYNASSQQNYSFEVQQVSSGNTPPSVRITQPFDGEITPLSVVLKYIGTDPDAGDNLFYDVTVTNDAGTTILSILKTQSTEIVLPNLLSGKYTAIVKVYDVAGANAEDRVSFTVSDKTNYLYVSARDFSSKSLLTILKASNVDKLSTVGSLVYDEPITDFDVVEDYIYAVSGNKLLVIDAKDKSSPTVKGSLSFDSTLSAVRIYKNYAILGVGYDKIEVVDVTDPSSPSIYRTFGSKIFSFTIPKSYNQSKTKLPFSSSIKKDSINITQGFINDIILYGDKAYIAADLAGIWELDLQNIPNITTKNIKIAISGDFSTIDIGSLAAGQVMVFGSDNKVGYISLPISSYPVKPADITWTQEFDTNVRRVKVHDGNIYIMTMDRLYIWDGSSNLSLIYDFPGSSLHDFYFVNDSYGVENLLVFDEVKGLWRFKKIGASYELYEPNKIYNSKDHVQVGSFIFLIGDGFDNGEVKSGLYAVDSRDPKNYIVRDKILNDNFVSIKVNSYGTYPKICVYNKSEKSIILYDFNTSTLKFENPTTLDLSAYSAVYDFAVDSRNNIYALVNEGGTNKVVKFNYGSWTVSASYNLPTTINQSLPYVSISRDEPVEPKNIEVVVDNLSKNKDTLAVLVALGPAGSIKLTPDLSNEQDILTRYYLIVKEQDTYTLKKYNAGFDQKIIADKYFDRIYVADGEFNGVWLLDKNGVNLIGSDDDKLSSLPLFEGAPARNISWYGDKLFVAGGGFGYKIIDVYQKKMVAEVSFSGLTYAFNLTSTDGRYLFVSTDNGLIVYDISNTSDIKPLFTLGMPMFKVIGR